MPFNSTKLRTFHNPQSIIDQTINSIQNVHIFAAGNCFICDIQMRPILCLIFFTSLSPCVRGRRRAFINKASTTLKQLTELYVCKTSAWIQWMQFVFSSHRLNIDKNYQFFSRFVVGVEWRSNGSLCQNELDNVKIHVFILANANKMSEKNRTHTQSNGICDNEKWRRGKARHNKWTKTSIKYWKTTILKLKQRTKTMHC